MWADGKRVVEDEGWRYKKMSSNRWNKFSQGTEMSPIMNSAS
jgi:hypothetical protein